MSHPSTIFDVLSMPYEATESRSSSAEILLYDYGTVKFEDIGGQFVFVELDSIPLAAARIEAREQIDKLTSDLLDRFKRFSRAKFRDVQALGPMLFNGAATTEHEPMLMETSQTRQRGPAGPGAWAQILPSEFNRQKNARNILTSCHKRTYTACKDIRRIFRTALVAHCRLYALTDAAVSSQSQQTDTRHAFHSPSAFDVGVDVKLQRFITTSDTSRQPAVHFCLHWIVKWNTESEPFDLLTGVSRITCRQLSRDETVAVEKTRKAQNGPQPRKRRRAPSDPATGSSGTTNNSADASGTVTADRAEPSGVDTGLTPSTAATFSATSVYTRELPDGSIPAATVWVGTLDPVG